MARVTIVGTGYVGLGTGVILADLGHQVTAVDVDATKVALLSAGGCPIFEPGLEELLARARSAGRLRFTTDYAAAVPDADFVFICVGTPTGVHGGADLRYVREAARSIGRHLGPGRRTVVLDKSTMPVGAADLVDILVGEAAPAGAVFAVVANPEFLREGSAVHDMQHPDRIVLGGSARWALDAVLELYRPFPGERLVTDARTAEMIKYAANAFLATKISFINEIASFCEAMRADVRTVARGIGLDQRIGPAFLQAGLGWGGSCFGKDVRALGYQAEEAGRTPRLLPAVLEVNAEGRRQFVRALDGLVRGFEGKTIAVWGLAFKPDTDDIRESPAIDVCRDLIGRGATVRAYDPAAMPNAQRAVPDIRCCADPYEAAEGADAVVLVTDWAEFRALDLARVKERLAHPILLDGRNLYDPATVRALGFTYRGIGLPFERRHGGAPTTAHAASGRARRTDPRPPPRGRRGTDQLPASPGGRTLDRRATRRDAAPDGGHRRAADLRSRGRGAAGEQGADVRAENAGTAPGTASAADGGVAGVTVGS